MTNKKLKHKLNKRSKNIKDKKDKKPNKEEKPFELTIDYTSINLVINIASTYTHGFYDPKEKVYVLDGKSFTETFFNETISKFSHYINAISNMRLKVNDGSLKEFLNAQKEMQKIQENLKNTQWKDGKLVDEENKPVTYD